MIEKIDKQALTQLDTRSLKDGEAQRLFKLIIDAIPFRIFWKDENLSYGGCNQAFCNDAGFEDPIEISGLTDFDLPWTTEEAEFYRGCDRKTMDQNESQIGIVETLNRADGGVEWLETSKVPLCDENNNVIGILGVYHDITKIKESEQKAIHENKRLMQDLIDASREAGKAEIATGVLHNVGNVMNSVNVCAGIMQDTARRQLYEKLGAAIELLDQQDNLADFVANDPRGSHLVSFLSQLKNHSMKLLEECQELMQKVEHVNRVVAAQQSFATTSGVISELNLAEVIENSLRIVGDQITSHRIQIERNFDEDEYIFFDQHRLIQALVNLYKNAIRAILEMNPPERKIGVTIEKTSPSQAVITVEDNGVGIPPGNIERIFQHGFSTNKENGGNGFGLHHSCLSIEQIGGNIIAESDGAGLGARFVVTLNCQSEKSPVG